MKQHANGWVEKGIRVKWRRYQAYVRVNSKQHFKTFTLDTPIPRIRAWMTATRRKFKPAPWYENVARSYPKSPEGFCYLYVVAMDADRVKIGRAVDVVQRIRQLQTACPERLSLLVAVPIHAAVEKLVHVCLDEARIDSEWFWYTREVAALVNYLRSGKNPLLFFWPDDPAARISALGSNFRLDVVDNQGRSGTKMGNYILDSLDMWE